MLPTGNDAVISIALPATFCIATDGISKLPGIGTFGVAWKTRPAVGQLMGNGIVPLSCVLLAEIGIA